MSEMITPATWDRAGLESIGFEGFAPLLGMQRSQLPKTPGVYAVLRTAPHPPEYLDTLPPKFSRQAAYLRISLEASWVDGTEVVYLGKTNGAKGLYGRVGPFARQSTGHSGGRSIWHLADHHELIVCWKEFEEARSYEKHLINEFRNTYGQRPFANKDD